MKGIVHRLAYFIAGLFVGGIVMQHDSLIPVVVLGGLTGAIAAWDTQRRQS
uniref:Uncharacterized protein n=1 Tax=viral metagenome TaxID=1070528 RepID=A0A6M3LWK0_9ZZZZ